MNKGIVLNLLQVWDPYIIYVFPEDEYKDYVAPILEYIKKSNNGISESTNFLYELIPPLKNRK